MEWPIQSHKGGKGEHLSFSRYKKEESPSRVTLSSFENIP
jgi:hypothetical protein